MNLPDPDDLENLAMAFAECCGIQVWFVNEGWLSKQQAVDNLQHLIESLNVPGEDRDAAQAIMAEAFSRCEATEDLDQPSVDLVTQWELADPRDRWKRTGDRPPADDVRNGAVAGKQANKPQRRGPPQATLDAFKYVVSLGNPEYLAKWLRDHSDVAPILLKQLPEAA
jgi:hypothetical protein